MRKFLSVLKPNIIKLLSRPFFEDPEVQKTKLKFQYLLSIPSQSQKARLKSNPKKSISFSN